jgi:hypothetical protein
MLDNATHRLGDGKRVILRQRARGSVGAIRAIPDTLVFLTQTGVVADALTGMLIRKLIYNNNRADYIMLYNYANKGDKYLCALLRFPVTGSDKWVV